MQLFNFGPGNRAYALHVKGNKLSDAKKYKEAEAVHMQAIEMYQKSIDKGARVPKHMMAFAVLLMRMHQFEKAHDIMLATERVQGITTDEKRQLRINYAVCEWKLGRIDKAIEQLKLAGQDGMNSMLYGSLGYLLIAQAQQTGDFGEAVKFNDEAMEYDDDDAVVLDNMGQLSLAMGDREKAYEYFHHAHERKPQQVDTLYFLGKMNLEDGNESKAKEYLTRAVEGNYTALCTTEKAQAQALLDSINEDVNR